MAKKRRRRRLTPQLAPGDAVAGYRVVRAIWTSRDTDVYEARTLDLAQPSLALFRRVALKRLRRDDPKLRAQFAQEAHVAGRIEHPNVVRVLESGSCDERPYLAMTFVPGVSLASIVERGRIAPRFAARLGREIALGLAASHDLGYVHGDVKPKNILINDRTERAYLTDFGLARSLMGRVETLPRGVTLGTPLTMSPEQAMGRSRLPETSDIYSLGATLYQVLTGTPLFTAKNAGEIMRKHVRTRPVDPRHHVPALPAAFAKLVMQAVRKDSADRPSALAFAHALIRIEGDLSRAPHPRRSRARMVPRPQPRRLRPAAPRSSRPAPRVPHAWA